MPGKVVFTTRHRNQRGLNLDEYEPQVARPTHRPPGTEAPLQQQRSRKSPAWLSHWSRPDSYAGAGALGSEIHHQLVELQCPTRRKSQLLLSPSSFGRTPRRGRFVNSTERAQKLIAPSAISHDLPMAVGTTLLSLVRSLAVAQLGQRGCPTMSYICSFLEKLKKLEAASFSGV